jgi:hypothetical protein
MGWSPSKVNKIVRGMGLNRRDIAGCHPNPETSLSRRGSRKSDRIDEHLFRPHMSLSHFKSLVL